VPCSHEALLKGHTKARPRPRRAAPRLADDPAVVAPQAVSTMALDPSAARLLTGSQDYTSVPHHQPCFPGRA
jgi:hypothetical protein